VLNLLTKHRSLGFHPYSHRHGAHRAVTQVLNWWSGVQVRHYCGWRECQGGAASRHHR
jgi:hypothetical protein